MSSDIYKDKPGLKSGDILESEVLAEERKRLQRITNRRSSEYQIQKQVADEKAEEEIKNTAYHNAKIKIMSSMIPDQIIYNEDDYKPKTFKAAILFADVSGFTDLSEKYNKYGMGGASKLSQVLNTYMGNMVQEILSHRGDVFKFSGDAFLVLFKESSSFSMHDAIHDALDTAIIIQKNYGKYETEVGVTLKVKIALSAGEVYFKLIGTEKNSHYMLIGQPVWDVKAGESLSEPGDVIVCQSAWQHLPDEEYIWIRMFDKIHYKVLSISDRWHAVQNHSEEYEPAGVDNITGSPDIETSYFRNFNGKYYYASFAKETFLLRPAMSLAIEKDLESYLMRFMIPPLMNSINIDEPLELLTEMRQVVIVFVNVLIRRTIRKYDMLGVVNQAYIAICEIVTCYEGVVNKVSFFDKDLMFLIIFGLRGFKHEIESQIGLRCASEIYGAVSDIGHILSTSIGVTTGMTYCGIVGHTLRREYSVISVTVNKAARLMTTYKRKVTCDSETFLSSRMGAIHFILQEPKELKGLKNVGPIYEFKEVIPPQQIFYPPNLTFPLLGRNTVLNLLNLHLENTLALYNTYATVEAERDPDREITAKTCVIFSGDTRQGKTRLLDEIFNDIHKRKLDCVKFTMHVTQLRKPYSAISLYISLSLGFNLNMPRNIKEKLILNSFRGHNLSSFMYLLNPIFDVNFPENASVQSLEEAKVFEVRRKLFKILCQNTFSKFWVVLVDDIEYADDDSFAMFDIIFETFFVFSIFTIGNRRKLSHITKKIFENNRVLKIDLEPIDRMYHAPLACQFLQVNAIPLNLEKKIQTQSFGNPGWIESLLVSLIQSNQIKITKLQLQEVIDLGLVFTEPNLMTRDKNYSSGSLGNDENDWNVFALTFTESDGNLEYSTYIDMLRNEDGTISVAILTDKFVQTSNEILIDSSFLIIYDSLSSYEQLICKCAAVMGDKFLRAAIKFVLTTTSERSLSLAFKKLVDMKIVSCASGDFRCQNIIYQRNINVKEKSEMECVCIDLKVDNLCAELPRYASCGYFQFKSIVIRDTIYNLLTDKQRKEFHSRALLYLEREARKCESCGGDFFSNCILFRDYIPKYRFALEVENYVLTISENQRKKIPAKSGKRHSFRLNYSILNFANYDFRNCECNMILYVMYKQILNHCIGAGITKKIIEVKIEYAYICIQISNIPLAITLLDAALIKLNDFSYMNKDATVLISYLYGRIYTLYGQCHYYMKQIHKASNYFYKAAYVMGYKFPTSRGFMCFIKRLRSFSNTKKLLLLKNDENLNETADALKTQITDQLSELFTSFFILLRKFENWQLAKLAAFLSLEMSLKYKRNFSSVITGFSNVLAISYHLRETEKFQWVQEKSVETILTFEDEIDANSIQAVVKLYTGILFCQTVISDKRMSTELGHIILKMARSIRSVTCQLVVLPVLFYLLLSSKKFDELTTLLTEVKTRFEVEIDQSGLTWYYALSLDILLDTGYTFVPYSECEQYYSSQIETLLFIQDTSAVRRFSSNMFLYSIRNEAWESATLWKSYLEIFYDSEKYQEPVVNLITYLRVLEGLILLWIAAIESRNVMSIPNQEKEIESLMKRIEVSIKLAKCHEKKYNLLKTFFNLAKNDDLNIVRKFEKSLPPINDETKDNLYYAIYRHNIKSWRKELTMEEDNSWRENCKRNQSVSLKVYNIDLKIYPFSLPLPRCGYF